MDRENDVDEAHDSKMVTIASASCTGCALASVRIAEQRDDRAEAGERGERGEHQHANAAFVLARGAAAKILDAAHGEEL